MTRCMHLLRTAAATRAACGEAITDTTATDILSRVTCERCRRSGRYRAVNTAEAEIARSRAILTAANDDYHDTEPRSGKGAQR